MPTEKTETLADTVERIREEKFPHLDKALVREILQLHGDMASLDNQLAAKVGAAIRQRLSTEG